MKKFILGLGTLASAVAPVAAVVACGVTKDGLPILTEAEQEKVSAGIAKALGMTNTTKGLFKFAFTNYDAKTNQLEMTLTRTDVSGATVFSKLSKSGTNLTMVSGESLEISFGVDPADNLKLTGPKFVLKDSKTTTKNGLYTSTLTGIDVKTMLLTFVEMFMPLKSSFTLTGGKVNDVLPLISNSSAQSFFYADAHNVGGKQSFGADAGKFTYQISMEKKTFDLKVDISTTGQRGVYGEDGNVIVNSGSITTKSTISFHFTGTFTLQDGSNPATYTFTKKEATIIETGHDDKTVTLNGTGSSEMTGNLMKLIFDHADAA